jgi:hypothetical protein
LTPIEKKGAPHGVMSHDAPSRDATPQRVPGAFERSGQARALPPASTRTTTTAARLTCRLTYRIIRRAQSDEEAASRERLTRDGNCCDAVCGVALPSGAFVDF